MTLVRRGVGGGRLEGAGEAPVAGEFGAEAVEDADCQCDGFEGEVRAAENGLDEGDGSGGQ